MHSSCYKFKSSVLFTLQETVTPPDAELPFSERKPQQSPDRPRPTEESPRSLSDNTTSDGVHHEISAEQDVIYCNTSPVDTLSQPKQASQTDQMDKESPTKDKKTPFLRSKSKLFRGTLNRKKNNSNRLSSSMHSLNISPKDDTEIITPVERQEHKFIVSYLCSAVVSPPLKSKHVGNCLKQYQREVGKKLKSAGQIGKVLLLHLITDEGITMADIQNPDAFRRNFPITTIDAFVMHPDNPDCFAFSTAVAGDGQRKYHVFYKAKENVSLVKDAFGLLKQTQKVIGV